MEIVFFKARNGLTTAQYNGINLHSTYNPEAEAVRFVQTSDCKFVPAVVLITEPGLSYCVPYLREKFPDSKIACIRYFPDFEKFNSNFDIVFNFWEHKNNFEEYFFNYFGEEALFSILFLKWEASAKAQPETDKIVWNAIKNNLNKAKTLLITREYFEKKWFLNSINYFKYGKNFIKINKTTKPVLIIASGPSLKDLLPILPEVKQKFYIICLSSAISVLKSFKINPDLYLSTDGGYWAGQHLKTLFKESNIPLAAPSEAYIPKKLLNTLKIVPLNYEDGPSNLLFKELNVHYLKAERNGTVSGTALKLAMTLTDNNIYFSGLDLYSSATASHTNPNEIEINNCLKDNKINSKEKRITKSGTNTASLNIYKNWFESQNVTGRKIYRIINQNYKHNQLGQIIDISVDQFSSNCQLLNFVKEENTFEKINLDNINLNTQIIDNLFSSENFTKQIFPLDFISAYHFPEDTSIEEKINRKKNELYSKVTRILNG